MLAQNLKLAEKLAKTNLRIEFLTACRRSNLTARFIQDSLRTVQKTFSGIRKFQAKCAAFAKYLLNGSISEAFEQRAYLERKRKRLYQELCDLKLELSAFNWVIDSCNRVFWSTIADNRPSLVRKFRALKSSADSHIKSGKFGNVSFPADEQENHKGATGSARVNNLSSVVLDPATEDLLARGPKFGLTPKLDHHLITNVEKA